MCTSTTFIAQMCVDLDGLDLCRSLIIVGSKKIYIGLLFKKCQKKVDLANHIPVPPCV